MPDKEIRKFVFGVIGIVSLFVVLVMIFSSFEQVEAGEKVIIKKFGKVDRIMDEGFYFLNPFTEHAVTVNTRIVKYEAETSAASKDMQAIQAKVALNYHVNTEKLKELYQQIGIDFEQNIIYPAIQESVKAGTAEFTAEELISKRPAVKEKIRAVLTDRLSKYYILTDDFSITNFSFSADFDAAIELKQVAEQKALQSANDLKRVEMEAKQQIERAKAEAESTRLQAEAMKSGAEVIELRKAEALLEFAKKWNGTVPSTMIMGGNTPIPLLNLK